jgi:hypothetical protein
MNLIAFTVTATAIVGVCGLLGWLIAKVIQLEHDIKHLNTQIGRLGTCILTQQAINTELLARCQKHSQS